LSSGCLAFKNSLCTIVHFPERETVPFRILAYREVTHLRHRGLGLADCPSQFLNLRHRVGDRGDTDIVGDGLLGVLARHQTTVRCVVAAAGIDVPVICHPGKLLDLPTEERAVKLLRALRIISRYLKPDNACRTQLFWGFTGLFALRHGALLYYGVGMAVYIR